MLFETIQTRETRETRYMAADGWVGIPGSIFHSFVERNIQVSSIASPYTKPNNSITQETR